MRTTRILISLVGLVVIVLGGATLANAQATRTWVSGVGDDANPCSRTAPCKTFAGAISKTATNGEINCLDPGGFGAVTITKSITIDCTNTLGGVLNASTNGVIVNGSGVRVVLRGLDINGVTTGINGINFLAGASLIVEQTKIYGQSQVGINVSTNQVANVEVYIRDTHVENSGSAGFFFSNIAGQVQAVVEKSSSFNNGFGLIGRNNARVTARESVFSGNATTGVLAEILTGAGPTAEINVESSIITGNGTGLSAGTNSAANQGVLRVTNSFISNNATGVTAGNGQAFTFGDNKLQGNTAPGAFTLPTLTKN